MLSEMQLTVFNDTIPADTLPETLAPYDVIVAMRERTRFDAILLDALPRLQLLVTTGMRNAAIDSKRAAENGVIVCGTGSFGHPTPEHAWALLMAMARRIPQEDASLRAGRWQQSLGFDLHGKTLGLVGFGKVAKVMATYANAFGMNVLAYSRTLTDKEAKASGANRAASLEVLLGAADIVSLHVTLSPSTHHLIGKAELTAMKSTALLINTSRAGVVDTAELIAHLHAGTIAGAAVDVFDDEPAPKESPLFTAPNTVLTPHLGYVTEANYARYFNDAVEDIRHWLDGSPVRVLVGPGG